ncbi:MAG TPA: 3-phosphoshikimate 1-carboxyvinyltransferase [Allosphingosinicella sp.]|nr:3-phosphoshikimate 1-carboxyvinyltransferase [Allosphingosinicella sp.]
MISAPANPVRFSQGRPLKGSISLPGDKSISHRAVILAAMALGESRITNLSGGEDVAATARALQAMGVGIAMGDDGARVSGLGVGGLLQPLQHLDLRNSGTSARLLGGLLATHPVTATLVGDQSLSRRPMERLIAPLRSMGAELAAAPGGHLPLTVRGLAGAPARSHRLTIASAQVKSALLLAGLNASGVTQIQEPIRTRDHSERMLRLFGAQIEVEEQVAERRIVLYGQPNLRARSIDIPGDPSSAAFLAVAALLVPGSEVTLRGIGANPMRTGLFKLLAEMGGDLTWSQVHEVDGEPRGDLTVRHSPLRGIDIPPELVPSMIDEFPIFFVAAAFAQGTSRARGLSELRVKESDRIAAVAAGLASIGATVEEVEHGLTIKGNGGKMLAGGATIASRLDHRIAMSFAVAGLRCAEPVIVDDMSPIATSYPGFTTDLERLTAQ